MAINLSRGETVRVNSRPWSFVAAVVTLATLVVATAVSFEPAVAQRDLARDLGPVAPSEVGISPERLQRLDAGMQAMVDDRKLAGVVTMLARHGKIVFVDVAGVQDIESQRPMARDSIFRIFSMTKPITGVAMMMLYEEGKWRLNDPVSRHIPEFADLKVYVGEHPDGSLQVEDLDHPITMRELMTHTAGLGYVLNRRHTVNQMFIEERVLNPMESLQTMIDKMVQIPLLVQPGTQWIYSSAVDVQGYLVEQLSGQPFAEFLEERILEPLGMVDTAFYVPTARVSRHALRHRVDENGRLTLASRGEPRSTEPVGPSGGGGLFGTAHDYLRFAQMLLDDGDLDGTRLLAPRTVEMMRTNHLSSEATANMRPGMGFGMDVMIYMDPAAAGAPHAAGTYYWLGLDGTWFWVDPIMDLVFVGMIQHTGPASSEVRGLARNLVYQAIVD